MDGEEVVHFGTVRRGLIERGINCDARWNNCIDVGPVVTFYHR